MDPSNSPQRVPRDVLAVGIDVAKEIHWAVATLLDPATGKAINVVSHRVDNTPTAIAELLDEVTALAEEEGVDIVVGIDILGGIARMLEVMLLDAGLTVRHVPGLAVKVNRRATRGGEHKSDPRDARVIADLVRSRDDLRDVEQVTDADTALVLLVGRHRELVEHQTERISRLRELLCSIHPGLERVISPRQKVSLSLLVRYVTPDELSRAGRTRILTHLRRTGRHSTAVMERLVDAALLAAHEQRDRGVRVPGEDVAASIIKELARELLDLRETVASVDAHISDYLDRHPDAALIQSLPGMGAFLTAELIATMGNFHRFSTASQLASAAGVAPALQQSGKVRYLQRATGGDRALKRVFYQSAFCALRYDPTSRTYYDRKRAEGKTHHKAVIALARRRVDVIHAMLRNREPYEVRPTRTSA
jgi:transposase